MPPLKVLIADDEPDILEILSRKIADEGYQVLAFYDGIRASEGIKAESPDVVVLDINMPGKTGLEVLKELRERHDQKWIPVIIVSARRELEDLQKGFDLDADHYLTKPCQPADIIKAIKLVLKLAPNRRAN